MVRLLCYAADERALLWRGEASVMARAPVLAPLQRRDARAYEEAGQHKKMMLGGYAIIERRAPLR